MIDKVTVMTPMTPYDRRVELVKETIKQNQQSTDEAARALAVQVLQALDHIPEKIR
jgi:hypothetical protein